MPVQANWSCLAQRVCTIVVANEGGDKNWSGREEFEDGRPGPVNVGEQHGHRDLPSSQFDHGDSGGDHDEHDGQCHR